MPDDNDPPLPPSVHDDGRLLEALCRAHPELIPEKLKAEIATSRSRVHLASAAA